MGNKTARNHGTPPRRSRVQVDGEIGSSVLLFVIAFVFFILIANVGPTAVGVWQDDGIYLCTAMSLAGGTGYRHIEMPTQPLQTKYPILYPAVLAFVFLAASQKPNLALLLTPTALAAAAMVLLWLAYLRSALGAPKKWAVTVGVLSALSLAIVSLVRFTMSDLVYGALSIAALLALDVKYASASTDHVRRRWLIVSASLVGLCALTRSFGLTLAAAVLLSLVLQRRTREAGLTLAVLAVVVAPWWIWQTMAVSANERLQRSLLEAPELSYLLWLPQSAGQIVRVAWQNIFRSVFGTGYYELALPVQFALGGIAMLSWRTACLHMICWSAAILILIGFVSTFLSNSAGSRTIHLYAILYAVLVLVWPFDPARFLVVWAPFLLYCLIFGLRTFIRAGCRRLSVEPRQWLADAPAWILFAVLMTFFVTDDIRIASAAGGRVYMRETLVDTSEIQDLEQWLSTNTSREDVIASDRPAGLFLAMGRRGHYLWPDSDPYALYYGDDRVWWSFYSWPGDRETDYVYTQMRHQLAETYAAAQVKYYVEHTGANAQTDALARIIAENPTWFELKYSTPKAAYKIYRVKIDSDAASRKI